MTRRSLMFQPPLPRPVRDLAQGAANSHAVRLGGHQSRKRDPAKVATRLARPWRYALGGGGHSRGAAGEPLQNRHTQQAREPEPPDGPSQQGRAYEHQPRHPAPDRRPALVAGQFQPPPSAKEQNGQYQQRPREHPQSGRQGQPGSCITEEAEQARYDSSPGERQRRAQYGDDRFFYVEDF